MPIRQVDGRTITKSRYSLSAGVASKHRKKSLIAPKAFEDIIIADVNAKTVAGIKPAGRLVNAERKTFFSTAQGSDEPGTDFLALLREAARYCKFETLETPTDHEAELIRMRILAGLKDKEEKLKFLDALRFNEN